MSSILAPNVGVNPVPVPRTTQNLNLVLGPSQWSRSNCQPVCLAPPNPNSVHQLQLSQGVFLMLAVPQAQGAAYQPGVTPPPSGTPFLRLPCCNQHQVQLSKKKFTQTANTGMGTPALGCHPNGQHWNGCTSLGLPPNSLGAEGTPISSGCPNNQP